MSSEGGWLGEEQADDDNDDDVPDIDALDVEDESDDEARNPTLH